MWMVLVTGWMYSATTPPGATPSPPAPLEGSGDIDSSLVLTVIGTVLAISALFAIFLFEDRKRTESVRQLEARIDRLDLSNSTALQVIRDEASRADRASRELLAQAQAIVREMQEARTAAQQLRPDFTTFVSNQWRRFDRMARYRYESC